MLSLFLSGTLSAAYIDCRSESGNTRVRLEVDDRRGDLKDIRFTRKIDGERWEMVGKKEYSHYGYGGIDDFYLCERNGGSRARYPLCIQEFDLARGFISVMFKRPDRNRSTHDGWKTAKGDVVFNLTSVEQSRNGRFRAVLFRSIYPSPEGLRVEHRRIPVLCKKRT